MNRLIILGNGFDIAHDMQTSYRQFISWLLKNVYQKALEQGSYTDQLIDINRRYTTMTINVGGISNVSDLIDAFYPNKISQFLSERELETDGRNYPSINPFNTKIKSDFFGHILSTLEINNWVDIENEYMHWLSNVFDLRQPRGDDSVDKFNNDFGYIISKLEEYLNSIKSKRSNSNYKRILSSPIRASDCAYDRIQSDELPEETMILNFNYTSTVERYLPKGDISKKFTLNYLHGKLRDKANPIIFGFGNEMDNRYEKIDIQDDERFFKYLKTYSYYDSGKQNELFRFIRKGFYQVLLMGHSCGLSDRSLMKSILENNNCISIKIYYHKKSETDNDYKSLLYAITKHFSHKSTLKDTLVSFPLCEPMPQIKKKTKKN